MCKEEKDVEPVDSKIQEMEKLKYRFVPGKETGHVVLKGAGVKNGGKCFIYDA